MAKAKPKTNSKKKPASGTKTAAKKKSAQERSAVKSKTWESLANELKSLIPRLDEEGLAFLVKQSQVHLYNMQVDALNETIIKDNERKKASAVKKTVRAKGQGFSEVKMSESGTSYYIVYNNEWIAFSRNEMAALIKIALGEGADLEVRERLFNWLSLERSDLLYAASIGDKFDDELKSLVLLLKNNFKLKRN
jgi:hypothetical protein